MICNQTENGWEIIFQRAHALLAAKLAFYWRPTERPARWPETLNAIAQHDNGWQEWERGDRVTAEGTPRDFTEMPLKQIVLQAERVVTRAWHQSLWSGLLVSRHVSHLYEPRRGSYAALDDLLERQTALRRQWRRWLKSGREEVERAYQLLLWADTFSLLLCRQQLPAKGAVHEIGVEPGGQPYTLARHDDGSLSVRPWPYEQHRFFVEIDVHHLERRTFAGDDALADALQEATVTQQRWELWTR